MEMPEQELPVIFSQMLQMFPNIPQEIIWMYVQRYSRDIEKCAQMLNLQNNKYTGLKSTSDTSRNLNEYNVLQAPHFMLQSDIILDNNNKVPLSKQSPLQSSNANVIRCINHMQQTEEVTHNSPSQSSLNSPLLSSDADVIRRCINHRQQTGEVTHNSPSQSSSTAMHGYCPVDSSRNLRHPKFINFNEPLILDIVPDDDDISHSWRPNVSADVLCSDLFVRSPMSENFQLNSNLVPSLNFEQNNSKILMNPKGMEEERWRCSNSSMHTLYGFPQQNGKHYEKDIASYLHYQKSQMNVIWYEVIKAKIEQSDLKEYIEKLSFELKEKMQSKSVQDIEELNEEIVQLRVECQCLCTDVDHASNDEGLLGEVDERRYEKNKTPSDSAGIQSTASGQSTNSNRENNATADHDDSNRWQCSKCTFANHCAINVCEMCSAPKPITRRPPFLHATSNSCYCHPKEESLSIQS